MPFGVVVMKLKTSLFLIISFTLGFFLGLAFKFAYESTSPRPYSWPEGKPPIIVNCYGKDFSKLQMTRAVHYWTIRGERIGFYEHNPPDSVCQANWLEGFIILKKVDSFKKSSTLASTKRYTSFDKLKGAVIFYKPGSQNLSLINEHELGHALGFAHVEIEGHIMHPIYHKMGRNFWIPAN